MDNVLDIFAAYATDEELEDSGAWVPFGPAKLLIARMGNRRYSKALNELVVKNQAALDVGDDAADALSDKIHVEVMADTILLGWENLGFKKKPVQYSREMAIELLKIRDFRREVIRLSNDASAYRAKLEEEQGEA